MHRIPPSPIALPPLPTVPAAPRIGGVFAGVSPTGSGFNGRLVPTMDERKLVTIVFGDISGFVQLAEKLDPEEVKR